MDRKLFSSRFSKSTLKPRLNRPAGGLIALGQRTDTCDNSSRAKIGFGAKRIETIVTSGTEVPKLKKPRLDFTQTSSLSTINQSSSSIVPICRDPTNDQIWKDLAEATGDLVPSNLIEKVKLAENRLKTTKIPKYLCAAIKQLFDKRDSGKIEPILATGLGYLVRKNPAYFQHSAVVEAVCALIKSQPKIHKNACTKTTLLGVNLLRTALNDADDWPLVVVKVFLDDSLTERHWVDRSEYATFVDNILTAFGTKRPSENLLTTVDLMISSKMPPADSIFVQNDQCQGSEDANSDIRPRFANRTEQAVQWTLTLLKDWWSRRLDSPPRALLRTMTFCCGLQEVRLSAAQKLDSWFQSAKQQKYALELLLSVCINCQGASTPANVEIIDCLLRLKALKSKPVLNGFCLGLRELLRNNVDNMMAVLKLVISNEFSPNKSTFNMTIVQQCFLVDNRKASEVQTNANKCPTQCNVQ